ncbi:MAG: hypothetical protein JXA94_07460 [Parachlamydiales bacterium]|nr:hypothetical protein [Parachlamydiales bacterium]
MKDVFDVFKIKKKTIYKVIAFHFLMILLLAIHGSLSFKKKQKHISVNTVVIKEKPKIIEKKQKTVAVNPKKNIAPLKKQIISKIEKPISKKPKLIKNPLPSNNIIDKLEKQLSKLDEAPKNIKKTQSLSIPESIKSLKAEELKNISSDQKTLKYKELLVQELQENLSLPEYGEVKVSFNINIEGRVCDVAVLNSKSQNNQNYLKNSLPELQFSWFKQIFDKEQNFIVIFKND